MNLPVRNNEDAMHMAYFSISAFTGLRAEQCKAIQSQDCQFVQPSVHPYLPRSFQIKLKYDKNLRAGAETRVQSEQLEHLIPCICLDHLKGAVSDLAKYKRLLKKDWQHTDCVTTLCPYKHISYYLSLIPDADGKIAETLHRIKPEHPSAPFFRARATIAAKGFDRRFLQSPLGKIFLKLFLVYFNDFLLKRNQ
jgi:hypothetical protein